VKPEKEEIQQYIQDISSKLLVKPHVKFWALGRMLNAIDLKTLPKNMKAFKSIDHLVKDL
jgi:hypothetical protein